ncbi:MAG: hypothetical protein C4536_08415 [Actinobacteria bacterium]|jgi:hypothetical protein|nr:MAG: hypothetical protein C4536_08415 [Actinomycetota bacterium]
MNTWRNLPGKIWVTTLSLDPRLRARAHGDAACLSPGEHDLFLAMGRYDLAHSMAVAARLEDDPLLHRAGLLHDAGKLRSELGIFTRWLYTGLELIFPALLRRICAAVEDKAAGGGSMEGMQVLPRGWRRGLYVQLHHGEIAAEMLARMGSEEELVRLVGRHQMEPRDGLERRLAEVDDAL